MAVSQIPPAGSPSLPGTAAPRAEEARADAATKQAEQQTPAQQQAQARKARNLEILQANQQASLSVGSQPLSLVYQAAIDAINEELKAEFGDNAIQRTQQEGLDVSPAATADRIVSLTTGLFARYQEARTDLEGAERVNRFVDVIAAGIEKGFAEAREILDGLGVLEGDIASNIDKTFELVQQGLEEFRQRMLAQGGSDQSSSIQNNADVNEAETDTGLE